ncbi:DUF1549 domain-containing protein [bacterium]|nr:DUF1549 domain-containing protein [bacterium]
MRRAILAVLLLLTLTAFGEEPRPNPIDAYLDAYWERNRITPSPAASDHELLRRMTFDVLGRPPKPDEVRGFEKSKDREKKIDELLASDEAAEYFADTWMRTLLNYRFDETAPARMSFPAFRSYLKKVYADDVSYKGFVSQILAETGDYTKKPAVNWVLVTLDPKEPPYELASRATRIFLGRQMQCARCHDHPHEKISQVAVWGMTAFFSGAKAKSRTTFDGFSIKLLDEPAQKVKIPDTETSVEPRFLDGRKPSSLESPRRSFADFVVTSPQFPRAIVNRVWAHFMGRGFVEPLDRFTEMSQPTHPELLATLSDEFVRDGTSLRKLARTILRSRAYQLSSKTVPGAPQTAHACMALKPQDPIQLLNTLKWTLELDVFLKGFYETFIGNKALPESYRNEAVFGVYLQMYAAALLAPTGSAPEEQRYTGTVRLALKLMNSNDLQNLVKAEWGRLKEILAKSASPEDRLTEIFYTLLGRPPSSEERDRYLSYIEKKHEKNAAYEDIYWTLLNSTELAFNH